MHEQKSKYPLNNKQQLALILYRNSEQLIHTGGIVWR